MYYNYYLIFKTKRNNYKRMVLFNFLIYRIEKILMNIEKIKLTLNFSLTMILFLFLLTI